MSTTADPWGRRASPMAWLGPGLTALAAAALSGACALTLPLQIDEYFTRNLALDPSLGAMLVSLRDGADGSFPAHPILAWLWMRAMPDADISLRATSFLFVVAFAAYLVHRLARYCPWPLAAAAVFLVLVDDRVVIYLQSGRFYGLLVFAFAWLFWSTWDLSRSSAPSAWTRISVLLGGVLTALAHPLGVLHVALLTFLHLVLALVRGTLRWRDFLLFLPATLAFVAWMAISPGQREINMVFLGTVQFSIGYVLWNYVVQASLPYTAALCAAALVLGRAAARWLELRRQGRGTDLPEDLQLLAYALAAGLGIRALVLALDLFDIVPVLMSRAVRYVLASAVAQVVLVALVLELLRRTLQAMAPPRFAPWSAAALSVAMLLAASVSAAAQIERNAAQRALSERALASLIASARERDLGIVFDTRPVVAPGAFFAAMRAPQQPIQFVLVDAYPVRELHLRSARHYPNPTPLSPQELARKPGPYVLVKEGFRIELVPASVPPAEGDRKAMAQGPVTGRTPPALPAPGARAATH